MLELNGHVFDQNLTIGAGTTLTELINILKDASDTEYFDYLKIIVGHLELVAHIAVRNVSIYQKILLDINLLFSCKLVYMKINFM